MALTSADAVAAGRALEACVAPPQLGALLAGGPAQLGISPFLLVRPAHVRSQGLSTSAPTRAWRLPCHRLSMY